VETVAKAFAGHAARAESNAALSLRAQGLSYRAVAEQLFEMLAGRIGKTDSERERVA